MVEKFWDFSVRTYYGEGVQEAFLDLQNQRGADINLLLFCIWYGRNYGLFTDAIFKSACEFSELWANNVVVPLRIVRTWMKLTGCPETGVSVDDCMQLRDKVKGVEFGAEKIQEEMLESFCAELPRADHSHEDQVSDAMGNIDRYFERIEVTLDAWASDHLETIMRAAIQGPNSENIVSSDSD